MVLDYRQEMSKVYAALGEARLMVLATSSRNRTTARMMSCVLYDGVIAFQTSTKLLKYTQIIENPHIALCANNISIEGVASVNGHPLDERNKHFATLYKQHHRGSFEKYSGMESNRVIIVKPERITVWDYDDGEPYRLFFDMRNQSVEKEPYATM